MLYKHRLKLFAINSANASLPKTAPLIDRNVLKAVINPVKQEMMRIQAQHEQQATYKKTAPISGFARLFADQSHWPSQSPFENQ